MIRSWEKIHGAGGRDREKEGRVEGKKRNRERLRERILFQEGNWSTG